MNEPLQDPTERRGRAWAYGLLVCALMCLTFELGRQRGYVDARLEAREWQDPLDAGDPRHTKDVSAQNEVLAMHGYTPW